MCPKGVWLSHFFSIKQSLILIQALRQMCWSWRLSPDGCRAGDARFLVCIYLIPLVWVALQRPSSHTLHHHQALQLLLFIVSTEGNLDPPWIPAWVWWSGTISNPLLWGFTPMGAPGQPTSSNISQMGTAFSSHRRWILSPSLSNNTRLWTKPRSPQT